MDARVKAGSRWLELSLSGSPSYTVMVKLSFTADEEDARRALEWWLRSPGRENGDVLEVS